MFQANMLDMRKFFLGASLLMLSAFAFGQQDYVGKFDVFAGYSYLESPHINLAERGFHTQIGVNPRRWYSLGFDYSRFTGHSDITPNLLPAALQSQLAGQIGQLIAAGIVPPDFRVVVPFDSTTQTFAAGPQLDYRHFHHIMLFIRPSIGAIRESVTVKPLSDPVTAQIVAQLAPSGKKQDWTGFYGFGGGMDISPTDHLGLRIQFDFVHDHLFNDLLRDGRNSIRLSIGPTIHFGPNVTK